MRELKIIGGGLCGLLAVGTLFSLLGSTSRDVSVLAPRVVAIIVFVALAIFLWRSGGRRAPRL